MAEKQLNQPISVSQHIVYICSRYLAYTLPLVFFLVTSSFYLKTYDSAQVKITFTQIGGCLLALVWITKMLVEGKFPFTRADMVYVAPFLAFLASGIISFIHSPFKGWALEETSRRVFYMVFALVAIAELRSTERMARLWRWLIAAAVVSIGYGFIQYLDSRLFITMVNGQATPKPNGLDPFIWRQAFGPRVFSTFGNPNFYGNFLVIITPMIFASILREKGPIGRPFVIVAITMALVFVVDKATLGMWGGYNPSYQMVYGVVIIALIGVFIFTASYKLGNSMGVFMYLILFALLFLNLYSTETKGAWVGFVAAVAITIGLIMEYFLRLEEVPVNKSLYLGFIGVLALCLATLVGFLSVRFVMPMFAPGVKQFGFSILWIPVALAATTSIVTILWALKAPWHMKKVVYSLVVFFVLTIGGLVLTYAQTRLISVSFRLFTWISTWEMVRTEPLLGNGVGTFKVIYPAFRRPHIIVLEGKSNTETDHAEDEYLEVWQDEGLVGFGIFLWLVITALACGLKQLRWYHNIRGPDTGKKRKLLEIQSDPRSYEVLGFLGAYMGALVHWTMDVSIRFVSSGIFSGLLPGILVAYVRNQGNIIREEVRMSYERWIRFGVAATWTIIIISLRMELIPQRFNLDGDTTNGEVIFWALLMGALIWILLEWLDRGLAPERSVPVEEQYPRPATAAFLPRMALVFVTVGVAGTGIAFSRDHFFADVHHNLAIFFSKNQIWSGEESFKSRVVNFPPDVRRQFDRYGGALEHYAQVQKNNPFFPMARYFTGNVYNDRGSQEFGRAVQLRNEGKIEESNRARQNAFDMWKKAEEAYENTKRLAPNYVQTHHQMGLLNTKRAEAHNLWGETAEARQSYVEALKHFSLYRLIDPVFIPNHDRMVQILLMDKKFDEAKALYKQAMFYHGPVAHAINNIGTPQNVSMLAVNYAKIAFTQALDKKPDPFHPLLPEAQDAIDHFKLATEQNPTNPDAWKGYGYMLGRLGRNEESQAAYRRALQISPNDPELKGSAPAH